jgi:uncharacterized protein (TIRG00374 family)
MHQAKKVLPFVVSFVLIIILVAYAPWSEIWRILGDIHWTTIVGLFLLSLAYYATKTLRFWYILRAINIRKPLKEVSLAYMYAQPISILPGGEIYRSNALNRFTGVPVSKSIGQFTVQGILEGAAMGVLMIIAALELHTFRVVSLIMLIVVCVAIIGIRRGYMSNVGRYLNRLPFIDVAEHTIDHFSRSNRAVFSRRQFPRLFLISLLTEVIGTAIAYISVTGIGGEISVFQAALFYIIPIIVGFISFLPGGFGLSEQSAVGILYLSKVSVGTAVAATLLMRVTIVGLGVAYGAATILIGNYYLKRRDAK